MTVAAPVGSWPRAHQFANGEVGYNGTGTLDNPSSKYGAWWGYDGSKGNPGAQWCNMFTDWVLDKAGVKNIPMPKGSATVAETWRLYGNQGRRRMATADPHPGDLVVFNYSDHPNHIGIVESYDTRTRLITSIQGNTVGTVGGQSRTGNTVRRKVHTRAYVVGYCIPQYVASPSPTKELSAWMATNEDKVKAIVAGEITDLKKWIHAELGADGIVGASAYGKNFRAAVGDVVDEKLAAFLGQLGKLFDENYRRICRAEFNGTVLKDHLPTSLAGLRDMLKSIGAK